jgi:mono/diheme cytochrome c family protein
LRESISHRRNNRGSFDRGWSSLLLHVGDGACCGRRQANAHGEVLRQQGAACPHRKEMPKSIPVAADETTYLAGAQVYQDHCAICHGLPNVDQTPMARGMFPKPPALFKGKGVTDDPAGETYWKVANGIRLTGMPEFKHSLNDTQMWQVSLLLANADKISDAVKDKLKPPSSAGTPGVAAPPATHVPTKPGRVPISPHSTPMM